MKFLYNRSHTDKQNLAEVKNKDTKEGHFFQVIIKNDRISLNMFLHI